MSKFELKKRAILMRRSGHSVGDIHKALGISKSTSSQWCREVLLNNEQKKMLLHRQRLAGNIGRIAGAAKNHEKKVASIKEAKAWSKGRLGKIDDKSILITGVALYWAEGSKSLKTSGFVFVNSDPAMIVFMKRWLVEILDVHIDDIKIGLSINISHKYRINEIVRFWSKLLMVPIGQFSKPYFINVNHKKYYENHEKYHGVLRLGVARSTLLKYRVLGLIDELKADVAQVVRADVS